VSRGIARLPSALTDFIPEAFPRGAVVHDVQVLTLFGVGWRSTAWPARIQFSR